MVSDDELLTTLRHAALVAGDGALLHRRDAVDALGRHLRCDMLSASMRLQELVDRGVIHECGAAIALCV